MKHLSKTIFTFLAAMVLSLGIVTPHADAARGWCMADPLIMVDGQLADVFVSSSPTMLLTASGPIQMVITIPKDSKGSVILTDLGFLKGYKISWVYSSTLVKTRTHTPVKIAVYAPNSGGALPVTVTFAPRYLSTGLLNVLFGVSANGYSNSWVKLSTG